VRVWTGVGNCWLLICTTRAVEVFESGIRCTFRKCGDKDNVKWMDSMQLLLMEDIKSRDSELEGTMQRLCGMTSDYLACRFCVAKRTLYHDSMAREVLLLSLFLLLLCCLCAALGSNTYRFTTLQEKRAEVY
jgi:hypothetical protein